jgi:putative nucleotidyltransferase with HDIG domain
VPSAPPMKWATQWMSVVVVSFAALLLALGSPYIFGHRLQVGEVADRDYSAPHQAYIVDLAKTKEAQDAARESTLPVLKKNLQANESILNGLKIRLDALSAAQQHPEAAPDQSTMQMAKLVSIKEFPAWRASIEQVAKHYVDTTDLLPGNHKLEWQHGIYEFLPDSWAPPLRQETSAFIASVMQPNVAVDPLATREHIKETIAHTKPVTKEITTGTLIVSRGEQLNAEDVSILNQVGITHTHDFQSLLGIGLALVAAFVAFGVFLYTFEPAFFFSPSAIALMATVCMVASGIGAAVGREYPQFVPVPATALILSVIFGRRVGIILSVLVIVFLGVSQLVDTAHLVALAAASGIALGSNITKRTELMLTGVLIGVIQAIAYFFAVMFGGMPGDSVSVGKELAQNVLGGLSSSIVAIGSLPFLEIIFGILTPFRVAELSEPDQPLMRQLEENAPGTYQHSLAVANLAEAGAKSIGADVNLVRAGAMYHDIGKMVTPRYFIENQLGDKNPHDEIAPEDSRAKVLAHVTNGLVLARKHGLPRQIQDFIPEHQGTTVMAYFYHKACMRDGVNNVKESDYRYPGPRPQCKETAIVMLADVSEAVTHSMRDPSQAEVEAAIGNVFKARWDDGQFEESELTSEELEKVKNAFVRVWRTLHHERLKYPATTTGRMPVVPQYPAAGGTQPTGGSAEASGGNVETATSAQVSMMDGPDC